MVNAGTKPRKETMPPKPADSTGLTVRAAPKGPPLISIGLTTYDRTDLLCQSVSAILNQTFYDF